MRIADFDFPEFNDSNAEVPAWNDVADVAEPTMSDYNVVSLGDAPASVSKLVSPILTKGIENATFVSDVPLFVAETGAQNARSDSNSQSADVRNDRETTESNERANAQTASQGSDNKIRVKSNHVGNYYARGAFDSTNR